MTAQQVHVGPGEGRGHVFVQAEYLPGAVGGGNLPQQIAQNRRAQGIIHHAVQGVAQAIGAQRTVGHLAAGIVPDLADKRRLRILLFQAGAEFCDEIHGQFVRHIQPPAGGSRPKPVGADGIFPPDDEFPEGPGGFVHVGQGVEAPPAAIFVRPMEKGIPAVVRGILAVAGAGAGEGMFPVEIYAIRAGMGEHAVQNHPNAEFLPLRAQGGKVGLRAEGGVDLEIIRGVVFMIGGGEEHRVQIQRRYPQGGDVGQLLPNAQKIAAEEIVGGVIAVGGKGKLRLFVPVRMQFSPAGEVSAPEEPVGHDLHHHPVAHPGGGFVGGVVDGDLIRGGLVGVNLPGAAQIIPGVAVIHAAADEIIPQDAGLFRQGEGVFKTAGDRMHGVEIGVIVHPEAHNGVRRVGLQKQPHGRAAGLGSGGAAIGFVPGIVVKVHKRTAFIEKYANNTSYAAAPHMRGCGFCRKGETPLYRITLSRCHTKRLYSAMVRSVENTPDLAVLITAIFSHLSRSV